MANMRRLDVVYSFYPVGQGLFSRGIAPTGKRDPYVWVYDCGTNSKRKYLTDSLNQFASDAPWSSAAARHRIDLLTISHFDHDHISGMVELLRTYRVRDLLLPYMPLWQRLLVAALEDRGVTSQLTRFLRNPAEFVANLGDVSVERIIYVGSRNDDGGEGVPISRSPDDRPSRPSNESSNDPEEEQEDWRVTLQIGQGPTAEDEPPQHGTRTRRKSSGPKVEFLAHASAIEVGGVWEFVPYNDSELMFLVTSEFRSTVSWLTEEFLSAKTNIERETWLRYIRLAYDTQFDDTGERRNLASLFLYAGPMGFERRAYPRRGITFVASKYPKREFKYHIPDLRHASCSALYTGDGYMDTFARFDKLRKYMSPRRLGSIGILQVMHHGSRNNWFEGIGGLFAPQFSVFSSQPSRKKSHPHQEVVRDFWLYRPVQVDEGTGAYFKCPWYCFE